MSTPKTSPKQNPSPQKSKCPLNAIVGTIWSSVLIVATALIGILVSAFATGWPDLGLSPLIAIAGEIEEITDTPSPIPTLTPSFTPEPTFTITPTVSPYQTATNTTVVEYVTPTATSTNTPVPFASGPIVIGYSVAGRPLEVYRFGTGEVKRIIIAGVHGGSEWNTIALAEELIAYITENPHIIPDENTLYILRSFNPDGEARGKVLDGRANENGVDLTRNWSVDWQPDWDRSGCWDYRPITSGPYPFSEPETRALMAFLLNSHVDALINYHSAAPGIYPAGDPPDEQSVQLARALSRGSGYPYPGVPIYCEFTGMLVDWAAANGIASVDLELTTAWRTDFLQNLDVLKAFLAWRR